MWKPAWLYESMPLLYLLAGGLCVWVLGASVPALLSALALATAGVIVYRMRREARRCAALRGRRGAARRPAR